MSGAVISVAFYPRYLHNRKHMEPIVIGATRRTLYDNMTVAMEEISAAEYARIAAPPQEEEQCTP